MHSSSDFGTLLLVVALVVESPWGTTTAVSPSTPTSMSTDDVDVEDAATVVVSRDPEVTPALRSVADKAFAPLGWSITSPPLRPPLCPINIGAFCGVASALSVVADDATADSKAEATGGNKSSAETITLGIFMSADFGSSTRALGSGGQRGNNQRMTK